MKRFIGISIVGIAVVLSSTDVFAQGGRGGRQGWGAGIGATQSGISAQAGMGRQTHRYRHGMQQGQLASSGRMGNWMNTGQANASGTQTGANGQRGIMQQKRLRDGSGGAQTVAGQASGAGQMHRNGNRHGQAAGGNSPAR
jgi:hypothetical protein